MKSIGYIKGKAVEVKPILEEATEVIMGCLEQLRECGVFQEEMGTLASSIENLEEVTQSLEERIHSFKEYDSDDED